MVVGRGVCTVLSGCHAGPAAATASGAAPQDPAAQLTQEELRRLFLPKDAMVWRFTADQPVPVQGIRIVAKRDGVEQASVGCPLAKVSKIVIVLLPGKDGYALDTIIDGKASDATSMETSSTSGEGFLPRCDWWGVNPLSHTGKIAPGTIVLFNGGSNPPHGTAEVILGKPDGSQQAQGMPTYHLELQIQ